MRITYATTLGLVLVSISILGTRGGDSPGCARDSKGKCKPINKTCKALDGKQIDWDCILGPESLEEVHERGGKMTTCPGATKDAPCSRFIVSKENERAEVKVQEGPDGFGFRHGEKYIFKYSFKAKKGMKVAKRFTHLGQIKGSKGGYMVKGDPIFSLTANHHGINVRFSNKESIDDFHPGMEEHLDWDDSTGEWIHVVLTTVFGKSMEVELSGAVEGKAVWPSHLKPVAWNNDGDMARMKLGLYHSIHNVADGEVEYKDISIEGPKGIIRTSPLPSDVDEVDEETCNVDPKTGQCEKVDITCDALDGNQIDWDCVFGPDSLEEVHQRGGKFTTCRKATKLEPCSRFIVEKSKERSEVKVQEGPPGFNFREGEKYTFKYSFKAKEGMKVSKRFTHLGQLKGSKGGYMVEGDPIYSLTANNNGLMVRFSNKESIEDYEEGMETFLDWEDATGEWVHVEVIAVFGVSMEVNISGAVSGRAEWPKHLKPVAWNNGGDMVRMKLGLYHSRNNVADGEVEYKNISIEGPAGIIRTSSKGVQDMGLPEGITYMGCVKDTADDRVLDNKFMNRKMDVERCADYCEGADYFGIQNGKECWCGSGSTKPFKHGRGTCTTPCSGDDDQICGGEWLISLYQYSCSPPEIPDGSKFLGCYKDLKHKRVLSGKRTDSDTMSQQECFDICSAQKAYYFGLENSEECFCGPRSDDYDKYGTATCSSECSGEHGVMCGGRGAISVYKIY